MRTIFSVITEKLHKDEYAALCRIIRTTGTTPRKTGAQMAVFADGSCCGTVGGGLIEAQAIQEAGKLFEGAPAFKLEIQLDAAQLVTGSATVLFEPFPQSLAAEVCAAQQAGCDAWLLTSIAPNGSIHTTLGKKKEAAALYPTEDQLPRSASFAPCGTVFLDPVMPDADCYLFGGGHVSQALAPMLSRCGFRIHIFEDRTQFAQASVFPCAATTQCGNYEALTADLSLSEHDYAVIMTRCPETDFTVLCGILQQSPSYIGVLGSKKKLEKILARLHAAGFPQEKLQKIHTPIGLAIGAETPDELAVSISAELILARTQKRKSK